MEQQLPPVRLRSRLTVPLALLLLGAAPDAFPPRGEQPVRAVILSWDGAVPGMIHDLLSRGKLPNLQRLMDEGTFADSVIAVFPSKTAPGHAAIWTGAPPRVNGVSGNIIPATPREQFTIMERASGFRSTPLRAEPIWASAARAGRKTVIVQATHTWPLEPYVTDGGPRPEQSAQPVIFEGYAGISGRDGVITRRRAPPRPAGGWKNLPPSDSAPLEIVFTIGATRLFGLFIDDPQDPACGYDTLLVTEVKDGARVKARLKPGPSKPGELDKWSGTVEIRTKRQREAGTYLRLFDLDSDGSDFLIYFTRPASYVGSHPKLLAPIKQAAGTFIGNGARGFYSQGAFGPTIPNGGDGTAERRYLETVVLTQRQLISATRWAMEKLPWDLLFTYTPYPDEAGHLWHGYLQADLPGYRQDIADRLRPFMEEVYRTCDEFLGLLMKLRPEKTILALISDHGMEGTNKVVAINEALRRAGLLVLDTRGRVDLSRTKAFYPPMNNGYILLNTRERKGGIVDASERPQLVARIRRALADIRDGGREVVTGLFDAQTEGEAMGIGGESGGDIYLELLPGYGFDGALSTNDLIAARPPYGAHGFNPLRPSMRTIMVLNGPGVAQGRRLGEARVIDFAPTLAKLLGIPAPKNASGRVLSEAIASNE